MSTEEAKYVVDILGAGITIRQYAEWRVEAGLSEISISWLNKQDDYYMAYCRLNTDEERLLFKLRFGI